MKNLHKRVIIVDVNKNFEANILDLKIYWRVWATHGGCFLRR